MHITRSSSCLLISKYNFYFWSNDGSNVVFVLIRYASILKYQITIALWNTTSQHHKCWHVMETVLFVWVHIIGPPSHWSPISLVPHLIGPPSHWFPISLVPQLAPRHHPFHWSPISLVPPTHCSPISLVPHLIGPLLIGPPIHKSPTTLFELIGPPFHWSPFSLIHPFSANPNGPTSHWSPSHWSPNVTLVIRLSLVPHLIGPPG